MRPLDTRSLQIFVAVAQCLNFRQAAEQLHMTQPPLSRAVRQLEQRLGLTLFERDTQHVALTAAASALLPRAVQILSLLDQAELALSAAPPAQGARIRLGLTTAVESDLLRAFTDALTLELGGKLSGDVSGDVSGEISGKAGSQVGAPGNMLEIVFADSPRLVAQLRARRLDAAIIAMPTKTFDLPVLTLGRQVMMVALPSQHVLARRRVLALADLRDQPVHWFERARQPAFFDHCHQVFRRHDFAPVFVREPRDHHVLLSDIAAGKGIALLPASFAAIRRRGVAYRKLAEGDALAIELGLIVAAGQPGAALLARVASASLA